MDGTPEGMTRMLGSGEAARRIGVSATTINEWVKNGKLIGYHTALGTLFNPADVEAISTARAQARARDTPDPPESQGVDSAG